MVVACIKTVDLSSSVASSGCSTTISGKQGNKECSEQELQPNLNSSNIDCSFTMAIFYSFLSPYEILRIAQENKYLRKFSYFITKLYVVCTL